MTVNDYLARRDSEWVGQVHRFLGLEVGLIQAEQDPAERYKAYRSDVTYVTNSELGFGALRAFCRVVWLQCKAKSARKLGQAIRNQLFPFTSLQS